MSIGPPRRTRQQRVAARRAAARHVEDALDAPAARRACCCGWRMCAVAAMFLWAFTRGWDPPFSYRLGDVPQRNIDRPRRLRAARSATRPNKARDEARKLAIAEYDQDPEPLVQLRGQAARTTSASCWRPRRWPRSTRRCGSSSSRTLAAGTPDPTPEEQRGSSSERFREAFAAEKALDAFTSKLAEAMAPFEQQGLLEGLAAGARRQYGEDLGPCQETPSDVRRRRCNDLPTC